MTTVIKIPKSIKLVTPIDFEGKKIIEIKLDFERLTGKDLIDAQTHMALNKVPVAGIIEFNKAYLAHVVAKASGELYETIISLKSKDFSTVTMCAQGFLL
ncbi:phage tail assembly protein [Psychrilyobacter sp.]|uniref:phage tail assembly protein n=1 Tax=Psychrilyobacter sp. TaxID=2586924 RepID=UPI00301B12CC